MSRKRQRDDVYSHFGPNPSRNRVTLMERMYLRVLTELSVNRFRWVGLPDSVDPRFIELTLFYRALCVFYRDTEFDRYLALRASGTGKINMYDNPTTFTVIGNTMVNKTLRGSECVPIWSNFLRAPDLDIVTIYATKLAEIDRTIEINLKAMRKPFLLAVDDNEKQSILNAYRQIAEGQPVIVGTTLLGQTFDEKVKLVDMRIDKDLVPNLLVSKAKIWNECMTLLGINNANQDKRERLVSDEVSANDSQVAMARNIAMESRLMAVEQINMKYNLSVKVEWNDETPDMMGAFTDVGLYDSIERTD